MATGHAFNKGAWIGGACAVRYFFFKAPVPRDGRATPSVETSHAMLVIVTFWLLYNV